MTSALSSCGGTHFRFHAGEYKQLVLGGFYTVSRLFELFEVNKQASLFQKFQDTKKQGGYSLMGRTKQLLLKVCPLLGMEHKEFQKAVHKGVCVLAKVLRRFEEGCGMGFNNLLLICIQSKSEYSFWIIVLSIGYKDVFAEVFRKTSYFMYYCYIFTTKNITQYICIYKYI